MIYLVAIISIFLGSIAQYFLKMAMNEIAVFERKTLFDILLKLFSNFPIYAGLICYALSMIFWLYVLKYMELSKAYPLVSIGYIFTLFISYFLLDESIPIIRILGVIIICIGVLLISKS